MILCSLTIHLFRWQVHQNKEAQILHWDNFATIDSVLLCNKDPSIWKDLSQNLCKCQSSVTRAETAAMSMSKANLHIKKTFQEFARKKMKGKNEIYSIY